MDEDNNLGGSPGRNKKHRDLYFFPYCLQAFCNPTSKNIFASHFLTQSAVKCGLRAHILEALPAGLTAAMQIYTKPKISSHLYHPL